MSKRSKLYRTRAEKIDRMRLYPIDEALRLLKELPACRFDETVELAVKLGIDPRKSDQNVRGVIVLPHGTGRQVRVAVVAEGEAAQQAREAGADYVGSTDLLEKIEKEGWLDFDVLIATPQAMQQVRRLGRILGPRGLMPNPKTGTVTDDVASAVREAKAGRVEYRNDRTGCIHVPIGKMSFEVSQLLENAKAVYDAIVRSKPAAFRGAYIQSVAVSSTMSPGVKVDPRSLAEAQN